jgi:outer membrane lipoprotein-sorting protein
VALLNFKVCLQDDSPTSERPQINVKNTTVSRSVRTARAASLFLVLVAAGCRISTKTTVPPSQVARPAREATKAELLTAYNKQAGSIQSVNATVDLIPTAGSAYSGVIEQYHDVHGFILAQRPASIRMIGQAPVVAKDVFDMTSDGKTFRIFIPSQNKFLVGSDALVRPGKKPIENLRPQHVLDALFWPEIPDGSPVLIEQFDALPDRFYILTLLRRADSGPEIARKIWFDRADLSISRVQVYGTEGRLDSDITYSDWAAPGAEPSAAQAAATPAAASSPNAPPSSPASPQFARDIHLRRPQEDYQLEIRTTKVTLNVPISADRFELAQPPGSQLVNVDEEGAATQHDNQPSAQPEAKP